jgi:SAM-dependent methyltransferase
VVDERVRTVEAGYDALGPAFGDWGARIVGDPWERFAGELSARLADGARVLDLGCGNGAKSARLAERFDVTGVDLSEEQVRLARAAAPAAHFQRANFAELELPPSSFDAVVALYSISHVPRARQAELFSRIARWLRPGGYFLASLGAGGGDDWAGEWLGVEMFFSSFDAETNCRLLREAGFEIVLDELVTMREPEGDATFLWVLAHV